MLCDKWSEKPIHWLKHYEVNEYLTRYKITINDLPIVENYSGETPCIICGDPGQLHHWAPQAYTQAFGIEEYFLWPTEYLCIKHHKLWHTIVTPELTTWEKE